ncbi:hypothetical protein D3C80_1655510 [compost metagenome]
MDELSSADNKGLYFGCAEIVKLGTISGPIAGGGLLGLFGFQAAWPVFGLLSVITLTGAFLIRGARIKHRHSVLSTAGQGLSSIEKLDDNAASRVSE